MKFRLTVLIVFSLCLSNVFADEGMWLLGNLRKNKQTDRVMKELGLQMPVNKIYDPKKPCLADAVVSFGGFCSGVVVSEDGLVFTNHHCGFSSIQQHSSVEHDYLKDGFFARSLEEELPNPELYVRFLLRTEDVTKRVLSAARHAKTETERRVAVDSIMNVISMEVSEKDSTLTGIVDAYYAGNEFWLSVYRDYNDVRRTILGISIDTKYAEIARMTRPHPIIRIPSELPDRRRRCKNQADIIIITINR